MGNKTITREKQFESANILSAKVTHNGYCGGDSVHGGFVDISIKNVSCSSLYQNNKETEEINFSVTGDTERHTLIQALSFIVETLKDENKPNLTASDFIEEAIWKKSKLQRFLAYKKYCLSATISDIEMHAEKYLLRYPRHLSKFKDNILDSDLTEKDFTEFDYIMEVIR